MNTITLDKKYKIEKVASTDETRYVLCGVVVKDQQMIATNGRILVKVPIANDGEDRESVIPIQAIKDGRKAVRGATKIDLEASDEGVSFKAGASESKFKYIDGKFPNYEQVIPDHKKWDKFEVSIAPSLLADLAEGMGIKKGQGIMLTFNKDNVESPIVVTSKDNDSLGVLMPMRQ